MTQNARPRYGTPRWVKWFAGIVVVLIVLVVVAVIFAEGEESDDDVPAAPTATEAATPTTAATPVPTATPTPTPRPTLAPASREEIASRCAEQYRRLLGNDEDGYRCGGLLPEGLRRQAERERQREEEARIETENREAEDRAQRECDDGAGQYHDGRCVPVEEWCAWTNTRELRTNPYSVSGRCFRIPATIWQFDARTGPCLFIARDTEWNQYVFGTEWSGEASYDRRDCNLRLYEDDPIWVFAYARGSWTFQTPVGGTNTLPYLEIVAISWR